MSLKLTFAAGLATLLLSTAACAADSQAFAAKLISMPGVGPGAMQLMDIGVMPAKLEPGMMVILCDASCQAMLHLAGKPAADGKQVAMGITMYVDNHSAAARLLGGH